METRAAQCCINVADMEKSVAFYEAIGLTRTNYVTVPENGFNESMMMDGGGKGGKIQLALQFPTDAPVSATSPPKPDGPIEFGNAFWKLYIHTNDIQKIHQAALDFGAEEVTAPVALDRWPSTISFVKDPSGYLVEFVQQDPWPDGDSTTFSWVGQYCIYVSDLEASIKFYETLGLTLASRTEIDHAWEAVLAHPTLGGNRVQLAQRKQSVGPIDMGTAMWKNYFITDDAQGVHDKLVDAGYTSLMEPRRLDRWPSTNAFIADPDGYKCSIVQLHDPSTST